MKWLRHEKKDLPTIPLKKKKNHLANCFVLAAI